jgi:hypothetical protein
VLLTGWTLQQFGFVVCIITTTHFAAEAYPSNPGPAIVLVVGAKNIVSFGKSFSPLSPPDLYLSSYAVQQPTSRSKNRPERDDTVSSIPPIKRKKERKREQKRCGDEDGDLTSQPNRRILRHRPNGKHLELLHGVYGSKSILSPPPPPNHPSTFTPQQKKRTPTNNAN